MKEQHLLKDDLIDLIMVSASLNMNDHFRKDYSFILPILNDYKTLLKELVDVKKD